jgi:N-succinyldiaminopimelate aminotransferase
VLCPQSLAGVSQWPDNQAMNPLLSRLQPYPFERLRLLHAGISPNPAYKAISLGIGEPRHATPQLVKDALNASLSSLSAYPATSGSPQLRHSISDWLMRRYALSIDPTTQIMPVNGSREALFSLAQAVLDPNQPGATVVCPNPFYQIYEGAALLGGADVWFANTDPARNFAIDWESVPESVWAKTQLLFVCSPGNPTGAVMGLDEWKLLFDLSDKYGFVIASDECYSEIYFRDEPPLGGLEAAAKLGRHDFKNLLCMTSLSKRSNVPGLRSGFVAGSAELIKPFLLYRTYHGSAMSPIVQAASIAAWNDEAHVLQNRALYREKFNSVTPLLAAVMDVALPDAGFYLWAGLPPSFKGTDSDFSQQLLAAYNVVVLPGSYLARDGNPGQAKANPGAGRIRMALVAETAECVEAAQRIVQFIQSDFQ